MVAPALPAPSIRKPATLRAGFRIGLILLLAGAAVIRCAPDSRVLQPGKAAGATLAPGESHPYTFTIQSGDLVSLAVEQRGIDVTLRLQHPDGREWITVDSPIGERGAERIFAVAGETGSYRLSVSLPEDELAAGPYTIRLDGPHRPSGREADLAAACLAFSEGDRLRQAGTGDSSKAAFQQYERALSLSEKAKSPPMIASARYRLGQVSENLGLRDEALQHYERARSGFAVLGLTRVVGDVWRKAARVYFDRGEVQKALGSAQNALRLYEGEKGRAIDSERAACLNDLGKYQRNLGEIGKAVESYEGSIRTYQGLGLLDEQITIWNNLAVLYASLGDVDQVRACLDQIQDLTAKSQAPNLRDQAVSLNTLGSLLERTGKLPESEKVLRQAMELAQEAGESRIELASRVYLARTLVASRRLEEARKLLREARFLAGSIGDLRGEGQVLANLGIISGIEGQGREALISLDQAIWYFRGMADPERTALALAEKAAIQHQMGDLDGAIATVREALVLEESMRQNLLDRTTRIALANDRRSHSDLLIDLLMEHSAQGSKTASLREAFEAKEQSRARTLLEDLVEAQQLAREGQPAPTLREQEVTRDLQAALHRWQLLQTQAGGAEEEQEKAEERTAVERTLRSLLEEQDRLQAVRLAEVSVPAQPWSRPLSLTEIQREALDSSKVLLSYHLGESRSFVWVVASDSLDFYELPSRHEIEGLVERARVYLERKRPWRNQEVQPVLERLSQILIEPVQAHLEGKTLLVSPDGALLRLPFSLLPVRTSSGGYHRLVRDHAIVTVPSASVQASLRRIHQGRRPALGSLASLADPVFTRKDERLARLGGDASPGNLFRKWLPAFRFDRGARNLANLRRLPYSRDEAEAIQALAPPGPRKLALGFDANVELVRQGNLGAYRYLHFATHGLLHSQPDLSSLVLSQFDKEGREQDGILTAYEISQLDLPVEMVVLSACETGLIEEKGSEEVSGLARAFLYAGARRVVASLWSVDDLATQELMKRFYRALWKDGLPPAEALRKAQNEMEQAGWPETPDWAAFVIVGEE